MASRTRELAQYGSVVWLSGRRSIPILEYGVEEKAEDNYCDRNREICEETEQRVELDLSAGDCHPGNL